MIFSHNTDLYHIGLTAVQHIPAAEVIVQMIKVTRMTLNQLQQALCDDHDLTDIPADMWSHSNLNCMFVQVMTTCTLYVSFLQGLERQVFFQHFKMHPLLQRWSHGKHWNHHIHMQPLTLIFPVTDGMHVHTFKWHKSAGFTRSFTVQSQLPPQYWGPPYHVDECDLKHSENHTMPSNWNT